MTLDATALVERTKRYGDTSFAELMTMEGVGTGDVAVCFPNRPNTILWAGLDQDTADQIVSLLKSEQLHIHPCSYLVYLADGHFLNFPIAKKPNLKRDYKAPHWLPVTLKVGPMP